MRKVLSPLVKATSGNLFLATWVAQEYRPKNGEEMTDNTYGMEEPKPKLADPFPNITFARRHRWGILDRWAEMRMERLGVPNPWHAYQMGLRAGELKARRELPSPTTSAVAET